VASIIASHAKALARWHKVASFDFDRELPPAPALDLAVVFGGDGTILRAARYLAPLGIPAIGVNLGKFGFLAGCVEGECATILDAAFQGKMKPIVRTMLSCSITGGGEEMTALNDIVVTASVPAQMIGIELSINGAAVSSFQGDGIIVSSATGSTGYNLSSGGPIVTPEADVMILTALAPHTLAIRPMVISGGDVVDLKVSARRTDVAVTADGQAARTVKSGDVIRVSRAPFTFSLYEGINWDFYRVVRGKLRWGEEPNYAKDSH